MTLPLVLMGLFRYQFISDPEISEIRKINGKSISTENPEQILIHDKVIRLVVFLWLISILLIGKIFY